jgi:hypothetical protein
MACGYVEGDDVYAVAYAKDVLRVGGIPEGSVVPEMCSGCQEEFEGYGGDGWWVVDECVGFVGRTQTGSV